MATDYAAHHLDRVASTQDEARLRFDAIPCLVTAREQAAGRGRSGSQWVNAPRALAASLAVEPAWPSEALPLLPLVAGLAARRAMGSSLRLKWPNDVVAAGGEKVAGILAERMDSLVIIGLGVNLFWPDPPPGVAGLTGADPGPDAGVPIASAWAEDLLQRIAAGPGEWGEDEYRGACVTIGQTVEWEGGGPAFAADIDAMGGLMVTAAGGTAVLRSGRVRSVRATTLPD